MNPFDLYESNMNTAEYIYWLATKGGWQISDEIYLQMDEKNPTDVWVEIRLYETDELIHREIDHSENVLEWLEENNYIID